MKLKKKQLCSITGITTETLRYYVKTGIITPGLNNNKTFNEYSLEDAILILLIRQLRSLGIPVSEIKNYISGYDSEAGLNSLKERLLFERVMVDHKINFLDFMIYQKKRKNEGVYLYRDAPVYAAFYDGSKYSLESVVKMQKKMPTANIMISLSENNESYEIGLAMSEVFIAESDLKEAGNDFIRLGEDRILLDRQYDDVSTIRYEDFKEIFSFAEYHRLHITSKLFCILIHVFQKDGKVGCELQGGVTYSL